MAQKGKADGRSLVGLVIGGKIRLEEELGRGNIATVYRGEHLGLNKTVAVKVLQADRAIPSSYVEQFTVEAQSASRLDHPHAVTVLDFGWDGENLLYIAMEFLDGRTLADIIRAEAPLRERRACALMVQALAALAAAHDKGIIHRDVKPDNIMVIRRPNDEGDLVEFVKVCDFGLAKLKSDRDKAVITLSGASPGTPLYMSPEQAAGDPLDERTDVYSAGAVLYELLTGKTPFEADHPGALLMKQIARRPAPPSELQAGLNPEIDFVVTWALEKRRDDRCPTARKLREALKTFFADDPFELRTDLDVSLLRQAIGVEPEHDPQVSVTRESEVPTGSQESATGDIETLSGAQRPADEVDEALVTTRRLPLPSPDDDDALTTSRSLTAVQDECDETSPTPHVLPAVPPNRLREPDALKTMPSLPNEVAGLLETQEEIPDVSKDDDD